MKKVFRAIIIPKLYKYFNFFVKKRDNTIYFIPHDNCKFDGYDIINYKSDNVLCLINYMLNQSKFNGYKFYIEYDFQNNLDSYKRYCKSINPNIKVQFFNRGLGKQHSKQKNIFYFFRAKYCFITDYRYDLSYKVKKQVITCLGYFTPFKNDFCFTEKEYEYIKKKFNPLINYYITSSDIAARIISVDSGISYFKFKALGLPRNDIFHMTYEKSKIFEHISIRNKIVFKKLILYTPTFRDYEYKKNLPNRSIFGYDENLLELNDILENQNAIILIKLHPYQNQDIIKNNLPNRIIIEHEYNVISLYDLLAVTDLLITDYTSAYFDYLTTLRPVVFNFYDKIKYNQERGFSFNPIDFVCAGDIVESYTELNNSIIRNLENPNLYFESRYRTNMFINKFQDSNSSLRICNEIIKV